MSDNLPTADTSIEVPVQPNIWGQIWSRPLVKEAFLMVVTTVAVQLALGLNDLSGAIGTAHNWSDLFQSVKGWAGSFSFALTVSVLKQGAAWGMARLAGTRL